MLIGNPAAAITDPATVPDLPRRARRVRGQP
jgi:hypothetical protein